MNSHDLGMFFLSRTLSSHKLQTISDAPWSKSIISGHSIDIWDFHVTFKSISIFRMYSIILVITALKIAMHFKAGMAILITDHPVCTLSNMIISFFSKYQTYTACITHYRAFPWLWPSSKFSFILTIYDIRAMTINFISTNKNFH